MSREIQIVTPENIPITVELAGLSTRFMAMVIDTGIQIGVALAIVIVMSIVGAVLSVSGIFSSLSTLAWAAIILLIFLLFTGYFMLFETIWNGQTPGKKVMNIRVLRDGGYPINLFSAVTRNLVRIVDFLPLTYGIGAASAFFSPQYKRLGDLAGGTLVVKEQTANRLAPGGMTAAVRSGRGTAPTLPPEVRHPSDVLTVPELTLLRRFAIRRWEMTPDDAERLGYRLVVPLVGRLNLSFQPGAPPRYADLVSVLVAAADAREE